MDIVYLGHASFKLKGKKSVVVTDPYGEVVGYKFPPGIEADIVTISHAHEDHNQTGRVSGSPFVVDTAGEYEVGGVSVFGIATYHDENLGKDRGRNNVFVIEIDGVKVCHLGALGHLLSESQVEEINSVDVLLVPVGGVYTVGPSQAVSVVKQLEPSIVIPMHYKTDDMPEEAFGKLAGVGEFLKAMGVEEKLAPKLSVSSEKLGENLEVIVLERKSS